MYTDVILMECSYAIQTQLAGSAVIFQYLCMLEEWSHYSCLQFENRFSVSLSPGQILTRTVKMS